MTERIGLNEINAMAEPAFVARFGSVFEHSPWVAEHVFTQRPFESAAALHSAMVDAVRGAGRDRQLSLIRAHPELAGKAATHCTLTRESTAEQASAGLDRCTAKELDEIRALNRAYADKYGFPFIMAVRGRSKHEILAAMRARLEHSEDQELAGAIDQIARIAWLRLEELIESQPA